MLVRFMDDFQNHIVAIDTAMRRAKKLPGYRRVAVRRCLAEVKKNQGIIFAPRFAGQEK